MNTIVVVFIFFPCFLPTQSYRTAPFYEKDHIFRGERRSVCTVFIEETKVQIHQLPTFRISAVVEFSFLPGCCNLIPSVTEVPVKHCALINLSVIPESI